MNEIIRFEKAIISAKNIVIISHVNPDGDTLGSMLGLSELIKLNYKKHTTNVVIG